MSTHPMAGKSAPKSLLVNVPRLVTDYYMKRPDVRNLTERVAFGTSGHRGSSFKSSFNEDHVLAITQAICDYRRSNAINGPLFLGMDTHALSEPSHATALEVLAANGVECMIHKGLGYTPTPVISHSILIYNKGRKSGLGDGIIITPSHNPPEDGGLKYNPPHGGPADTNVTQWVEERANDLLRDENKKVRRIPYEKALRASTIHEYDYVTPYVEELQNVIDMKIIRSASLKMGVDPMGGSTLPFWEPIAKRYGLNINVVNPVIDPTFGFMTLDGDGQIRMDCSSQYAMARLIRLKKKFDIAFGNDPDGDRHGIVTPSAGLMNPNHFLSVAVWYLFRNRPGWRKDTAIGKTFVTSSMIDRVANHLGRKLFEVPVGFKWFVVGLLDGSYGFAGEESAGASLLRNDGTVWTTDKDGIISDLLAAEITARTGSDPGELYQNITDMFGNPIYERIDVPATLKQQAVLNQLSPHQIATPTLAGDAILAKMIEAPGNKVPIGGIKIVTENGWCAVRPSGTEKVYKIYTESFKGREHLMQIQAEAKAMIGAAFRSAGV
ncbi:MAG: alpha-D-glucose phosphate-specific phosphoglucomutase [Deltaproteobacteria bacterium]|nr:alpha-D-glucose phosphate-specific phosphoglucomutase [Deltaproteobacteria bacterium]